MAKKKKVNDVIPPDAPPEVAPEEPIALTVENLEAAMKDIGQQTIYADEPTPGRAAVRLRLEEREINAPPQPFRQLADGRYCETTHTREREVRIAGQRYEHVAEDDHGYWIYDKS